jgi:ELWxxDGT repeat protein
MRRRLRLLPALAALLLAAPAARAAEPHLVIDLNPGVEAFNSSTSPDTFYSYTPVNGRVVFLAHVEHGDLQCGLWATDGTAGSTERLVEFCGGDLSFADSNSQLRILTTTGAVAFFTDFEGKLWRTDGTAAGTFALDVIVNNYNNQGWILGPDGRTLFFQGCAPAYGCELWRSDGTREGTALVRDLEPGGEGSLPALFVLQGRRLLFVVGGGPATVGVWATDGTAAGTFRLISFAKTFGQFLPHGGSIYFVTPVADREVVWVLPPNSRQARRLISFPGGYETGVTLQEAGEQVLMVAFSEAGTTALWTTDGTRAGTRPLVSGNAFPFTAGPVQFGTVGKRLVFTTTTDPKPSDLELWFIDPGMKSPRRLLGCPEGCPRIGFRSSLTVFRDRVLFAGWDPAHGRELWSTDGTGEGTRRLQDLCAGPCDGLPDLPLRFHPFRGRLLLTDLQDGAWATDGTPAGTARLSTLLGLPDDVQLAWAFDLAELDGRAFFTGVDGDGPQPWVSDLTPGGARPIQRLGATLAASSRIQNLAAFGGRVLFSACDGTESSVWSSDGTAAGTVVLGRAQLPCYFTAYVSLGTAGDLAFFAFPYRATDGGALWSTDGTAAGTRSLLDLSANLVLTGAALGKKLLFRLQPAQPPQLFEPRWDFWTSDGTPQGTQPAFQLRLFGDGYRLAPAGDAVLFSAHDPDPPFQSHLWIADGTEAGPRQLLNIQGDPGGGTLTMARLGNKTFFVASGSDRNATFELWSTDGTAAGTVPVIADQNALRPVFDPVSPSLVAFQGQLYFFASAEDPKHQGLWRSDGTAAGTRLIRAIDPPTGTYNGNRYFLSPLLTPAGNQLFFRADDGVHGTELWRSDGTPEGTVLVKDIAPGPAHSRVGALAAAGDEVYFAASDGEHGAELWVSDGTAAGTRMVADVLPGPLSSSPLDLTAVAGKLFFTADDGEHGRELWVLPLP